MARIEDIPTLSEAELDDLPHGIIRLDRTGKILYCSRAQAELARRSVETTVGLNFFTQVAPCAAVRDFQGRFNDFVATPEAKIEPFSFEFRFPWGLKRVSITMVKRSSTAIVKPSSAESSVYIVVMTTESGDL